MDFDETEDQLVVVYNDALHGEAPDLELRLHATDPSLTEVVLGDDVLATLPSEDSPSLEDVILIAESAMSDLDFDEAVVRHM